MKSIIIALDTNSFEESKEIIDQVISETNWFKVGMQAFYSQGEQLLNYLFSQSAHIFLDLKLHDIPTTVIKSTLALLNKYPVDIINIHALGGFEMMKKTAQAIHESSSTTKLIGVTILTSHSEENLREELKLGLDSRDMVKHLNTLCLEAGLDGVVCSPLEAEIIKELSPEDYLIITPGVRFGAKSNDQKRVATPSQAFKNGASHIVIGREITQSNNPLQTLKEIKGSIHG